MPSSSPAAASAVVYPEVKYEGDAQPFERPSDGVVDTEFHSGMLPARDATDRPKPAIMSAERLARLPDWHPAHQHQALLDKEHDVHDEDVSLSEADAAARLEQVPAMHMLLSLLHCSMTVRPDWP